MSLRQAVSFWCFDRPDLPLLTLCREAKRIGYQGLEMVPEDRWSAVRSTGLSIVTHVGHASIADGLTRTEHHPRIEAEIRTNLAKAAANGIPILICFSGNRAGLDDDTGLKNTVTGLKRLAPLAESAGVMLVLELLNSKVDHADYQGDRTAWGAEVVRRVGSPRVKLLYDIYHMQIMEGDVLRTIEASLPAIGHLHAAGNPGRRDLDDDQELNYRGICRRVAALGYDGWLGQEFLPKGDPIEALERAYRVCSG